MWGRLLLPKFPRAKFDLLGDQAHNAQLPPLPTGVKMQRSEANVEQKR